MVRLHAVVTIFVLNHGACAFVNSRTSCRSPWPLFAGARRSKKVVGGPTKKKNKKQVKIKKQSKGTKEPAPFQPVAEKPKLSRVVPPWQVISKKDMKRNVQAEKERRELAQSGVHMTPAEETAMKMEQGFSLSDSFLDPSDKSILKWKRFSPATNFDIDFVGAYLENRMPPRLGVPEIAFLGRSNVGKSSLLNRLVSSEAARVGKTPGATASVNLYSLYPAASKNKKSILGLVDLPGFGYAKLSKESKESVQQAAENYLSKRKELVLGILLVDIRRVPSEDDRAVLAALFDMGHPIVVVATKVDKLSSQDKVDAALKVIRNELGLPEGQPLCVSSVNGDGIRSLWKIILEACESGVEEYRRKLLLSDDSLTDDDEYDDLLPENDEIAYDQGFDWIHDTAGIMYEGDDAYEEEDEAEDENEDDNVDERGRPVKETMKYLRKLARDKLRKNEV